MLELRISHLPVSACSLPRLIQAPHPSGLATGLAIAAILLWANRVAPAIFIAAFLINQITAGSIFTSLAIAGGNTLEAVLAGYLVRHWAEGEQVFETPTGVTKFALISLAATVVSATIGVSSLTLAGYAEISSFISVWLTWWLGDLAGALVVAPVVVLWAKSEPASLMPPQITRTGLTYLAAIAAGVIAFSPLLQQTTLRDALVFLVILPLLWASLRQGPRDTATVALIISAFVVWCTANAVRALRQAKSQQLIHTVAGLHDQRCSALPRSEYRCSGEIPH